ncbi:UDP-glycosyltransferase 89B2-like [Triticum urartu]|uniref:UDP-glycosyltransferase 89B2-like n=1 Tax=Triticum urartu TaxID=4572 RepID=UPI002043EB5E|nr:UDP-glycosyltransferase 89B2-like [Triticum urartu]
MPSSIYAAPQASASNGVGNGDGKPHVLVVPYPAHGHMLPLLDLAALLTARGLALTVTVTAGNVPLLATFLAAFPSVATVILPFPSSPFLPAGCGENTKDLPADLFRPFMASLAALSAPLLSWCKSQPRGVTAIVSDLFMGWTLPLIEELGVPHVAFSCANVHYLATTHSLWVHVPGDEVSETIRRIFLWNIESSCFVANLFVTLEAAYVERPLPDLMAKWVFAVGALSDDVRDRVVGRVRRRLRRVRLLRVAAGAVTGAGGVRGRRSSAGSVAFVWAVRSGTVVPEGFEAAATAASRGMAIRGWAPQVEILRHRAVGWFLTHCGWNSVLEATAAGVAMLTWPMGADQFINASVLAEAGVAVPVAEGADAVPDAGKMASVIAAAVTKEGESVRKHAVELGRKAATVVAEGGTSHIDLEELVRVLSDVDYSLRS